MSSTAVYIAFGICCLASLAARPTSAKQVTYKDCGSVEGVIHSVDITPCTSDPCVLKVGANVTGTVNFTPKEAVQSGQIEAWAIFGLVPVPLPLPNPNFCQGYGVTCPLKSGVAAEMVIKEFISFPPLSLTLKGQIKEQSDKVLMCFEIPLTISE